MEFSLPRDEFYKYLNAVSAPALSGSGKLKPIFSNALLDLTEDGLRIVCLDNESEMSCLIPISVINVKEFGSITASAAKLLEICKSDSGKSTSTDLNFKWDPSASRLEIMRGKGKYSLNVMPAENFPESRGFDPIGSFQIAAEDLKEIIKTTSFAMANNDVRAFLNGTYFELNGRELNAVTSDSHRIAHTAYFDIEDSGDDDRKISIIVPKRGVSEITALIDKKLGKDQSEKVKVEVGKGLIRFFVGDIVYVTKLIDGQFPQYKKLFPAENSLTGSFVIDREELLSLIKNVSFLSDSGNNWLQINLSAGLLKLSCDSATHEQADYESDNVEYSGDPAELTVNHNFLTQVLSHMSCPKMLIKFNERALQLDAKEDSNYRSIQNLIMLIKR